MDWKPTIKPKAFVPDGSGFQIDEFGDILLAPSVVAKVEALFPGTFTFETINDRIVRAHFTTLHDFWDFADSGDDPHIRCSSYCRTCDRFRERIVGRTDGILAYPDVSEDGLFCSEVRYGNAPIPRPIILCGDKAREALSKQFRFLYFNYPWHVRNTSDYIATNKRLLGEHLDIEDLL